MHLGLNVSPQPSQFEKETPTIVFLMHSGQFGGQKGISQKTLKSSIMSFARIKNTLPHGYNQRYNNYEAHGLFKNVRTFRFLRISVDILGAFSAMIIFKTS
jgi:hypothetical protein